MQLLQSDQYQSYNLLSAFFSFLTLNPHTSRYDQNTLVSSTLSSYWLRECTKNTVHTHTLPLGQ